VAVFVKDAAKADLYSQRIADRFDDFINGSEGARPFVSKGIPGRFSLPNNKPKR